MSCICFTQIFVQFAGKAFYVRQEDFLILPIVENELYLQFVLNCNEKLRNQKCDGLTNIVGGCGISQCHRYKGYGLKNCILLRGDENEIDNLLNNCKIRLLYTNNTNTNSSQSNASVNESDVVKCMASFRVFCLSLFLCHFDSVKMTTILFFLMFCTQNTKRKKTVQVAVNGKFLINGNQKHFTVSRETTMKHAEKNQILPPRMYAMGSTVSPVPTTTATTSTDTANDIRCDANNSNNSNSNSNSNTNNGNRNARHNANNSSMNSITASNNNGDTGSILSSNGHTATSSAPSSANLNHNVATHATGVCCVYFPKFFFFACLLYFYFYFLIFYKHKTQKTHICHLNFFMAMVERLGCKMKG